MTDSLYLLVAQVPRPRDMAIFVLTTTTTTTTRPITLPPCECARGNNEGILQLHAHSASFNSPMIAIHNPVNHSIYPAHAYACARGKVIGCVVVVASRRRLIAQKSPYLEM